MIPATKKVNDLLSQHPTEVEVLIRLSSKVLQNPTSVEHGLDHTVTLTKPAAITEDPSGDPTKGKVSADVFTWGKVMTWTGTVRQWQRMVWAYVVAATRKGIL